ncbi:hypothetical protein DXT95_05225 [Agrobacterium tumefaciens]|nr:hypothetical protein [Agrobacterium tumefaciens]
MFNSTLFANAKYPTFLIPFLPLQPNACRHSRRPGWKSWIFWCAVFWVKSPFFHHLTTSCRLPRKPASRFADHGNSSPCRIVIDTATYRDILL